MSETAIQALERIAAMDCATGTEARQDVKAWIYGKPARVTSPVDVRGLAIEALATIRAHPTPSKDTNE
jgi:hypothetical protein